MERVDFPLIDRLGRRALELRFETHLVQHVGQSLIVALEAPEGKRNTVTRDERDLRVRKLNEEL